MHSLIPGFKYDIFISYRQKDNKYDGWVTGFVNHLKGELESTFKEEISVYFDNNPNDGLLELHGADASQKEKLKCLVFIPIISRTYCEPGSFAWENEFKTFIEQASKDQFGLKVILPNGDVACRVLPVRIHDLDSADIKLCESILGGAPGGIEFIYKSAGVNRPLRFKEDSSGDNLNKTFYRDQINKVALSIKEIILGLKSESTGPVRVKASPGEQVKEVYVQDQSSTQEKYAKYTINKIRSGLILLTLLLIAATIIYPKIFKGNRPENLRSSTGRISVAVMPFQNMTNDTAWNVWQEGVQDNLITYLSNYSDELEVKLTESINSQIKKKGLSGFSITPSAASSVSQLLNASAFIYGTIKNAGSIVRINAQLLDSGTEEVLNSFQIEGSSGLDILSIIDTLSIVVRDFLVISVLEKKVDKEFRQFISTGSAEAYRYQMYGLRAFYDVGDYAAARNWFLQAAGIDSNSAVPMTMISYTYGVLGIYEEAKKWCLKAYGRKDLVSFRLKPFIDLNYASYFETPEEEIKYENQLLEIDDQFPYFYFRLGLSYSDLFRYEEAIPGFKKYLAIHKKLDKKPGLVQNYIHLGYAYHQTGQYKKEKLVYRDAEKDFPDDDRIILRQAILSFTEGDTIAANEYIRKFISVSKVNSVSEADISTNLAMVYSESGIPDQAEEYYKKALLIEPEMPPKINNLAYFLIDKDRNIDEGLRLAKKALEISPDDYNYLHTEGWGLYKQDRYKEALEILQKSWDLRMKNAIYDHQAFLHLGEAKKAGAGERNN